MSEKIKPNRCFNYIEPDTVAECWNGVYNFGNLYKELWDCVDSYDKIDKEDCGPHDVIGINSVARFWDKLSPENQAQLNKLVEQNIL